MYDDTTADQHFLRSVSGIAPSPTHIPQVSAQSADPYTPIRGRHRKPAASIWSRLLERVSR